MKKRILALFLAFILCGALVPAALADGEAFRDVPVGSWYAQGVDTCAGRGGMIGTGEGLFSPENTLTNAECLTLALRIYDLRRGGTGELEKAPADWGTITFTLSDGTAVEGERDKPFWFYSFKRDGGADAHLCFRLTPEEVAWGKSVDAKAATVMIDGKTYTGVTRCWEPTGDGSWFLSFYPDDPEENVAIRAFYNAPHPDGTKWYRDVVYTAEKWGLNDKKTWPGFWDLGEYLGGDLGGARTAYRYQFANALAEAAGDLPKLFEVEALPDLERDDYGVEKIFALYEAGILTGSDESGTFDSYGTLTRAQAAVMVARVLDESQRITTPPKGSAA